MTHPLKKGHRLFDLADGQTIWKYSDFPKFIHMLEYQDVFLCRSDLFEDQLEGNWTKKEWIEREKYLDKIGNCQGAMKYWEQLKTRCFISCWHANKGESIAMWKIYGGGTHAVAVVASARELFNQVCSLELADVSEIYLQKVIYRNYEKSRLKELPDPFLRKRKPFGYEQEVRLIVKTDQHEKFSLEENKIVDFRNNGIYAKIDLSKLVEEVVVAFDAPDWFYDLVAKIVSDKFGKSVRVRWSSLKEEIGLTYGDYFEIAVEANH